LAREEDHWQTEGQALEEDLHGLGQEGPALDALDGIAGRRANTAKPRLSIASPLRKLCPL